MRIVVKLSDIFGPANKWWDIKWTDEPEKFYWIKDVRDRYFCYEYPNVIIDDDYPDFRNLSDANWKRSYYNAGWWPESELMRLEATHTATKEAGINTDF
jgi:hypothetical protein